MADKPLGMYQAVVAQTSDPLRRGRIQVRCPQILGNALSAWALPSEPPATLPNIGDTVWFEFAGGDISKPVYIWSGSIKELTADKITTGTLQTGTKITAGDPNGSRLEIDGTTGLQAYNADGTKTFSLDIVTGNVEVVGHFRSEGYLDRDVEIVPAYEDPTNEYGGSAALLFHGGGSAEPASIRGVISEEGWYDPVAAQYKVQAGMSLTSEVRGVDPSDHRSANLSLQPDFLLLQYTDYVAASNAPTISDISMLPGSGMALYSTKRVQVDSTTDILMNSPWTAVNGTNVRLSSTAQWGVQINSATRARATVTPVSGWGNWGSGWASASYTIDPHGMVHLDGMVKRTGATYNTTVGGANNVLLLPAEARPNRSLSFAVTAQKAETNKPGPIRCDVYATGYVLFILEAIAVIEVNVFWVNLSGVRFTTY
jgi:hypothetical protein